MKALAVSMISLFCFQSVGFAANAMGCLQTMSVKAGTRELTTSEIQCIQSKPEFSKVARVICTKDQSSLSAAYSQFLDYQPRIQAALNKFLTASSAAEKTAAGLDLQSLQQDQAAFAQHHNLYGALNLLGSLDYDCRTSQPAASQR
jgi:hypothetical protein